MRDRLIAGTRIGVHVNYTNTVPLLQTHDNGVAAVHEIDGIRVIHRHRDPRWYAAQRGVVLQRIPRVSGRLASGCQRPYVCTATGVGPRSRRPDAKDTDCRILGVSDDFIVQRELLWQGLAARPLDACREIGVQHDLVTTRRDDEDDKHRIQTVSGRRTGDADSGTDANDLFANTEALQCIHGARFHVPGCDGTAVIDNV